MDDENAHDSEENAQLSLLDLPNEMFLQICTFLDASTLVHGLNLACKYTYDILNDDNLLWKARLDRILPNEKSWKLSCVAIKEQRALWKQPDSMEKLEFPDGYSAISVLLMSVDGIPYLVATKPCKVFYTKLSYPDVSFDDVEVFDVRSPHRLRRDCSLTAIDNTAYSCCTDNTVKSLLTNTDGLVYSKTYEIKCDKTDGLRCMSSCPEQARFAIGSADGTIYVYDSRSSSNKPISQYRPNNAVVTNLAMNAEYILSASLDGTVSIWDQRTEQIKKSITIPGNPVPWCISMQWNLVCIGDDKAKLHMLNLNNDIELVNSYSIRDTNISSDANIITGVYLTRGCLITSSYDGTVRISSPTDPPRSIATLAHRSREINSMDYLNDTLAIAGESLVVWRPRNRRV
ncbi:F-box/WD repeat-containing protein 9-like [Temnothorax nylanderi]|uniref:F-box/WD repeat-containing protein 9-like n=1 Tax=Temnothorax nylanderi TaxID=102681 RepID=UPI003A8C366F